MDTAFVINLLFFGYRKEATVVTYKADQQRAFLLEGLWRLQLCPDYFLTYMRSKRFRSTTTAAAKHLTEQNERGFFRKQKSIQSQAKSDGVWLHVHSFLQEKKSLHLWL